MHIVTAVRLIAIIIRVDISRAFGKQVVFIGFESRFLRGQVIREVQERYRAKSYLYRDVIVAATNQQIYDFRLLPPKRLLAFFLLSTGRICNCDGGTCCTFLQRWFSDAFHRHSFPLFLRIKVVLHESPTAWTF